jgi:hypothetical protein
VPAKQGRGEWCAALAALFGSTLKEEKPAIPIGTLLALATSRFTKGKGSRHPVILVFDFPAENCDIFFFLYSSHPSLFFFAFFRYKM